MMTQQMQQDQDMDILTSKRPFFSIVIPCYNSGKTIGRLLETITQQDLQKDDIQVIISDDCSTESYQDVINQFKDRLFITQVKTDYNYCPGNTRQRGVDAAIGEWVCFSDHDDEFVLGSLRHIKEAIKQSKCNTVLFAKFLKKTLSGQFREMPQNAGWTHGKFFNLDNFWKKYNIHYVKDMTSHQDVCISTQIEYTRTAYDIEIFQCDIPTYIWIEDPNSLSNRKYVAEQKERVFLDVFFIDYIESTAGTSYGKYKETNGVNKKFVSKNIKDVLLYSYFYFEFAKDKVPEYLRKNCDHVKKYIAILQDQFNTSIDDIYNYYKFDKPEEYDVIFKMAVGQTDIFLYEHSFKEWLKWIWNEEY